MPFLVKSNIFYGKESIFPPWKLCLKKMILRSLLLNIFLWDEDAEYPAASLPLQQPVKGGKKYTWVLCFSISLDCSCQSARIFFSRHHEETISCDSPKIMLFRIPFLQSNHLNSESFYLPPEQGGKHSNLYHFFYRSGWHLPVNSETFAGYLSNIAIVEGVPCHEKEHCAWWGWMLPSQWACPKIKDITGLIGSLLHPEISSWATQIVLC